jgi:omega-6 fatty acid desaturase (delta-12 desaturase)
MLYQTSQTAGLPDARRLFQEIAPYRDPNPIRSITEIVVTALPFAILWGLIWASLDARFWPGLLLMVPAAGLLVRLFLIQHDCGHGAFFRRRSTNDWVGRLIGVLTVTPYDCWRRSHAQHHATSGNLDSRGMGDIDTLTLDEFRALSPGRRLAYRLYRHPAVMFGIGPAYQFLLRHRLPLGRTQGDWRPWVSAMGTNAGILLLAGLMMAWVGVVPFLLVQLPITVLAASMGVWLFYVQHQFDGARWERKDAWGFHDAALHGSSHYDLPPVLRWFSANIGVHHVHHLSSRIPYYRLPEVLRDRPELRDVGRLTLWQSLKTVRLVLWHEQKGRLISFREMSV